MSAKNWEQALALANDVRLKRAKIKREIKVGKRDIGLCLELPEVQNMLVQELLIAQPRWGLARANRLMLKMGVGQLKKVGSLSKRQKQMLINGTR